MYKAMATGRAVQRPPLSQILRSLVVELAEIGGGSGPAGAAGQPYPGPDLWVDDHHVYLELDLPGEAPVEADVSIHRGKIFIRLEL